MGRGQKPRHRMARHDQDLGTGLGLPNGHLGRPLAEARIYAGRDIDSMGYNGVFPFQATEYCVRGHGNYRLASMPKSDAQLQGLLSESALGSLHLLCDFGDWCSCLRMPAQLRELRFSPGYTLRYTSCHLQTPLERDYRSAPH